MKRIRKSLVFFAILTTIILSTVFILPSMLFADTYTFNGIGEAYYNDGYLHGYPIQVKFYFDVSGVDLDKLNSATLKIWADDVDYEDGEIDDVYFEGNYVGHLVDEDSVGQLSEFSLNPSWITLGQNNAVVRIDVENKEWEAMIYDSELILETGKSKSVAKELEPAPWVRDHEMQCYQVWINESNNFEFVFWWEYKNNNWVKIYDMEGSEVFSIDMKKGDAHFEADLPDGFYTVKTFHNGFETPIQEFLIGKP